MIALSELRPRGRLDRAGFWFRHLTVVPLALWIVIAAGQSLGAPYDIPLVLVFVALLVSTWGRRLHDRGHSAWWLLGVLVPVVGAVVLVIECGFRGAAQGDKFDNTGPVVRPDYLSVEGAPNHSPVRQ